MLCKEFWGLRFSRTGFRRFWPAVNDGYARPIRPVHVSRPHNHNNNNIIMQCIYIYMYIQHLYITRNRRTILRVPNHCPRIECIKHSETVSRFNSQWTDRAIGRVTRAIRWTSWPSKIPDTSYRQNGMHSSRETIHRYIII